LLNKIGILGQNSSMLMATASGTAVVVE